MITRPPNFKYKPGDYIFVNVPAIARYEWHPFTISSAPEQKGVVWLHIRVVGTWTKKLYQLYKRVDTYKGSEYAYNYTIAKRLGNLLCCVLNAERYSQRLFDHRKSLRSRRPGSQGPGSEQHPPYQHASINAATGQTRAEVSNICTEHLHIRY